MRRSAGTRANHVAGFVDMDVLESQAFEQAFQLFAARFFVKRRRGNLTDADLFVYEMRLVAFDGVEGGFNGGVVHKPGSVLREDGRGGKREKEECSHIKKSVTLAAFDRGAYVSLLCAR